MDDQGYSVSSVPCDECGATTVVEPGRGWWCVNPQCRLSKSVDDMHNFDKYHPEYLRQSGKPYVGRSAEMLDAIDALLRLTEQMQQALNEIKKAHSAQDTTTPQNTTAPQDHARPD